MPQGAALSERGKLVANPAVLHAKVEQGTDGLVRTAAGLVRDLTGGTQGGGRTVVSSSSGGGSPAWIWPVVAAVGAAVLVGVLFFFARLLQRRSTA